VVVVGGVVVVVVVSQMRLYSNPSCLDADITSAYEVGCSKLQ